MGDCVLYFFPYFQPASLHPRKIAPPSQSKSISGKDEAREDPLTFIQQARLSSGWIYVKLVLGVRQSRPSQHRMDIAFCNMEGLNQFKTRDFL